MVKLELGEKGKIGEKWPRVKIRKKLLKKRVKNGREGIEKKKKRKKKEGKGKESHQMS